ncbi:MAG TPA: hypothetical protein VFP68_17100, partial [Burkholderiaceae bacterium]|nr:hypothetical protein [Burkholderiaceae bacterium]
LLAPQVLNDGVISAKLGTVALAAGDAVTLDVNGSELLGVKVDPATVAALVDNRELVQAEGGHVILSAGAAQRLREQAVAGATGANALVEENGTMRLVSTGGRIEAGGGQVSITGSTVNIAGQVQAGGTQAGSIAVQADHVSQSGTLDASATGATNATSGIGGRIEIDADTVVQTASARLQADGAGAAGSIRVTGDERIYSSGTYSAQGTAGQGGDIALTAKSVQLRAATVDASGATGGGRIRVGGGFQGHDSDLANAKELGVNGSTVLRADASVAGSGGQVVLWSDDSTTYGGRLSARGGTAGGDGGRAEVSGKGDLVFGGSADLAAPKGQAGQLLLDPRNIMVDNAGNSIASLSLDDPTPSATNGFGTVTQVLSNGNVIISAPNASTGGSSATGAVYLFNSSTGALLSDLRGSNAGDRAGSGGVKVLGNGNYLVLSPQYGKANAINAFSLSTNDSGSIPSASAYAIQQNSSAYAGAITWQSGVGSGANAIGSGNSLVGSTANTDSVSRYTYSGNAIVDNGSITVTANDRLGNLTTYDTWGNVTNTGTTRITELADGNVAIAAPNWFNGRGAVAWMNGSTGALANGAAGGALSSSTAIVGSTGIRSQAVVDTDSNSKKVYVIGVDQSLPYTYTQGATNRRTAPPGGAGDSVGQTLTALPDGSYVVSSPLWTNDGTAYAGAVTRGAAGGSVGAVSSNNSLVGSHAYDFAGSGGVSVVGSGNYVVASPYWSDSANGAAGHYLQNNPNGAVTWANGSNGNVYGAGSTGAVMGSDNSLTGTAGSGLGARNVSGITHYTTYDYNTSYILTTTSSSRSTATVSGGMMVLHDGNYLVVNDAWNGSKGAVTFGSGSSGVGGAVSASNSLVGSTAGDSFNRSVVELSASNYLVVAPYSDVGAIDGGAVTWGSGTSGVTGTVSTSNSLYGNQVSARVGLGGALPVGTADGQALRPNAIVLSPQWGNRSASTSTVSYGAVTWIDGSHGNAWGQQANGSAVSSGNSLVGSNAGDYVGSIHTADTRSSSWVGNGSSLYQVNDSWDAQLSASVDVLANGDYIVRSPNWGGGKGAISWGAGASGTAGSVSSSNSLVGSVADVVSTSSSTQTRAGMNFTDTTYQLTTTGDHVGLLGQALSNGNYVAISPYWSTGRGAITWIGSGNRTGTISSTNSLVGSTPDIYSDVNQSSITTTGDRLGTLPDNTWVVPVISEATVSGQTYTTSTVRPVGPYSFDRSNTVTTANWYGGGGNVTLGKNYSVTPPKNLTLTTDSGYLTTDFQYNGTPIVKELSNGNVLVASPGWNNASATRAGAVNWMNGATGALADGSSAGTLSAGNSLVGSHTSDVLGFRLPIDGVSQLTNGNFLLVNPQWYDERGAVTWGSGTAGVTGTVSSANSLVGDTASGSLGFTTANNYLYRFVAGSTINYDWVDRSSDASGDRVGLGGVSALSDGNAVIGSPFWRQQAGGWSQYSQPSSLGAATWINGSNGQLITGAVGGWINAANSLVGSQYGDAVGYSAWVDPWSMQHYVIPGVTALAGGNYVVASPWWTHGSKVEAGAVTFGPAGGIAGEVSTANSLVGGSEGDHVGRTLSSYDSVTWSPKIDPGIVRLDTGSATNYLVRSVDWTNTYATNGYGAGAATWVSGSTGRAYGQSSTGAVVSASNSLVGNTAGDGLGGMTITLTRNTGGSSVASGDMLLLSNLEYCGEYGAGAITLLSGASGAAGPISWRNSVIGLASNSNGLQTSTFNGYSYYTDVRATLLPTPVTAAEQIAWRPLVWAAPAQSGGNASQAKVLTLVSDSNTTPATVDQINGTGGNANWTGSLFAGTTGSYGGLGASGGLLAFSTNAGSDVVIPPSTITSMLNAGTAVTLQASNDITVMRDIVASAGGHGGDLTLEAGRSVHLRANIDTDGGNFAAHANQAAGVVDADCSVCAAVITQQTGTTITTGSGNAAFSIDNSSTKSHNDAGTVRLASVDAREVLARNAGVDSSGRGQGIRFQPGAVLGNNDTEYLTLSARGTSAQGGGIVLGSDTVLQGAPWGTIVVGASQNDLAVTFGGASSTGFAMTQAEMGSIIRRSIGFPSIVFGNGSQSGATTVGSLDFTQASMQRDSSGSLSMQVGIQGGSGGVNVTGALKSGAAGDYGIELRVWNGVLNLASTSSLTANTGILSFNVI